MDASCVVHVIIRGRVQGVGYRAWTHHQAELRGLEGWVRNRRDGTVEAVFSGPRNLIEAMLHALEEGPAGARVETVDLDETNETMIARPGSGRFEVLATK